MTDQQYFEVDSVEELERKLTEQPAATFEIKRYLTDAFEFFCNNAGVLSGIIVAWFATLVAVLAPPSWFLWKAVKIDALVISAALNITGEPFSREWKD